MSWLSLKILHLVYPFSVKILFFKVNNNSLLLSVETRGHITQAIQSGWADSTVKHYSSAIKQFIHFCDTERIPEHLCFPADEFVLCAFTASSLGKYARTTPCNHLSALKAWHIAHNLEWKVVHVFSTFSMAFITVHLEDRGTHLIPLSTQGCSDSLLNASILACPLTLWWQLVQQ